MPDKKIASSLNVRINVGNYQHIELTKYAEKSIAYDTKEDMVAKENELTEELLSDMIRSMRTIPERLGKKTNAVQEIEERITVSIPEFMVSPDQAKIKIDDMNAAKKKYNTGISEQKEASKEYTKKAMESISVSEDDLFK
jgi:hypothetical protein